MADEVQARVPEILAANALDMESAAKQGLGHAMQDRLRLNPERLATIASGIRQVATLPGFEEAGIDTAQAVRRGRPA